ncbi:MAG: acetate kinase, partial [Candidatus Aminicenantes bacterium]|nr:acetate kinase [Candidatus Aminicenantes bacterium]
ENSPIIRSMCCEGLEELGIRLDAEKNEERSKANRDISSPESRVKILIIPTNEEKRIARETKRVLRSCSRK